MKAKGLSAAVRWLESYYNDPYAFRKPVNVFVENLFSIKDDLCKDCVAADDKDFTNCYMVGTRDFPPEGFDPERYGFGLLQDCFCMTCHAANAIVKGHGQWGYGIPLIPDHHLAPSPA